MGNPTPPIRELSSFAKIPRVTRRGASSISATGATVAIFSLWRHWPIEMATVTLRRCAGFPAGARGFQPALVGILPAREKAREGRPARCLTLRPRWPRSRRKSGEGIFQTSATTPSRICTFRRCAPTRMPESCKTGIRSRSPCIPAWRVRLAGRAFQRRRWRSFPAR